METWYDEDEDILNIDLRKGEYWKSVELPSGIVIDVARDGSITAIEIHNAKKHFTGDLRKVLEHQAPLVVGEK